MKRLILIILLLISVSSQAQYYKHHNSMGIYIGGSVGSYLGADFGSTFPITFWRYHDYDDYNYNYYESDRYNDGGMSPVSFDLGMDFHITDKFSTGIESSIIWHMKGKPKRDYKILITNGDSYIEKWDNATMYAIPIFLNLKYYPFGKNEYSLYLSGGYGWQYISESVDRVRDRNFDNSYYYNSYSVLIGNEKGSKWMQGVKAAIGMSVPISDNLTSETEIKVTNFFPTNRNQNSHLAMNTTTNITFIALTTKVYFNF